MSLIVKTRTPSSPIRPRSPSSTERAPTIAARTTDGDGQAPVPNSSPAAPSASASGMPWTFPLGDVPGRFMSAWASIQSTPPAPRAFAIPPSVPIATEWSPPSTSGR